MHAKKRWKCSKPTKMKERPRCWMTECTSALMQNRSSISSRWRMHRTSQAEELQAAVGMQQPNSTWDLMVLTWKRTYKQKQSSAVASPQVDHSSAPVLLQHNKQTSKSSGWCGRRSPMWWRYTTWTSTRTRSRRKATNATEEWCLKTTSSSSRAR